MAEPAADDADEEPAAFHLGEEPAVPEAVVPEPPCRTPASWTPPPEPRTDVDDLFARIRAAGPAEVAAEVEGPAAEPAAAGAPADQRRRRLLRRPGRRARARCRRRSPAT